MNGKLLRALIVFIFLIGTLTTGKAQTWQWAKSGDGTGGAEGTGVCVDGNGNSFITGGFGGPTVTFGSYILTNSGSSNVFLTKYDSNGNVLWAKNSIGSNDGGGYSVSSDASGNSYIAGIFQGSTIVFGTYTLNNSGGQSVFLTKYDPNGNVIWAKNSIGSAPYGDVGYSVSTDENGNSYLAGSFASPTIIFGSYTLTNSGSQSVFLTKYDSNGNVLWAKSSISSGEDNCYSVSKDINGNAYITGYFNGPTIVFGSYTLTNIGYRTVFLAKYDSNGNVLWAKNSLGPNADEGMSVSTDIAGNAYITGQFSSPTVGFGSYTLTNSDFSNIFLVKYYTNGNVHWAKNLLGQGKGYSLSTDANNIYMSGSFGNTLIVDTYTLTATPINLGADPAFVARFDLNGNANYAYDLASGGDDIISICVDKHCNAYLGGDFKRYANPPPPFIIGTNTLVSTGGENVFLAKLSFASNCLDNIHQITNADPQILIYPNPNSGEFKILMENEIENGELILVNVLGQKLLEQKITRGENNISAKTKPGLYHYIILQNKQQIGNGKMVIE